MTSAAKTLLTFAVSLELVLSAAPASAFTYYVSPTGNDDNSATLARSSDTPWRTLTQSVPKLSCGDVLYVRGGTYATEGIIRFSQNCADDNRVQMVAANLGPFPGDGRPLISWPDRRSNAYALQFYLPPFSPANVAAGITVEGLEFFNGFVVKFEGPSARISIVNNVIHNMGENGILGPCFGCVINRNAIFDNGDPTIDQCDYPEGGPP